MRPRDRIAILPLVATCYAVIFAKIFVLGYSVAGILPQRHYELEISLEMDGHGEDARVRAALPPNTERQQVREETFGSPDFGFHILREGVNRWGIWEKTEAKGHFLLTYSGTMRTEARRFALPDSLPIPVSYPAQISTHLMPTQSIQADDPEIRSLLEDLVPPESQSDAVAVVRAVHAFVQERIAGVTLKGTTDAITALRLGEAACGGKSRLFAALTRAAGLPTRLVGGLILKDGSWRSTHIWDEVYLGGHWVPFDALNGHFAEIPSNYLILYYDDYPMFTYTRDTNFGYLFFARKILAPPAEAMRVFNEVPAGLLNLWAAFEQVRIPLNLLKIILMVPVGALVVVVARNIVGIHTFGTFMPALLAVAFRDTGLAWGLALFGAILVFGGAVRVGLERFSLLHTPRLAVMLTATVLFMMGVTVLGVATGWVLPTRVSLFPIVILTLTVERFVHTAEEDGTWAALRVVLGTAIVTSAAYASMTWEPLQVLVVTFPETLLLVMAAFIALGRWPGLRLLEYVRFRHLAGR